ncbi:glucoamylase family protein [Undibacterium arcticum]|uniref:glucoamylase family protein n=1 Tax=Undibacterium arcticum TaxID=1762892 RepID=UPI0036108A48
MQQLLQSERQARLTLSDTPQYCRAVIAALQGEKAWANDDSTHIDRTVLNLQRTAEASEQLLTRLREIRTQAQQLFNEMDFKFLFDTGCGLFSIGYRVADAALDSSHYDLLASEARLTSFIAVAKGDVPATHWLRLGRPLMAIDKAAVLLSWSGSMFEYLMPSLVMYTPRHSLLNQTCRLSIERQVDYGSKRGVPWGISESAFNVRDRAYTYQYRAFGVPGLGLKRGLEDDLVIAPYATALAAMYDSRAAIRNMDRLEAIGARGPYGFYEAVDFTKVRLPENEQVAMVRAYMAHHQAMSLIAVLNVLQDGIMRHRFHREPIVKAADLLLQERTPREVPIRAKRMGLAREVMVREPVGFASRRFHSARLPIPSSHLLSNGQYAVMVTAAGSGYSQWGELAVTRWREDATCDDWGSYLFMRDVMTGEVWSATYQPIGGEPANYQAVFFEDRARIERRDGTLSTALEILVSPEDNAEIRHLSITNSGSREREIEITSYAEVVLAPPASDMAHPAFSNLFVQTEYLPEARGLLASRRPRKPGENRIWAAHVIATDIVGAIGYETDRMRFLGRGHTVRDPVAVMDDRPLSNTVGPVLDPVFSLRTRLRVAPGATVHATFSTIVATSREAIVSLADKYHDPATFERISTLAWTQAQVQLHYLGITPDEAHLFQYLANRVLFADPLRSAGDAMKRNQLNVRALWRHGISGDRPIVFFRIDDPEEHGVFLQLLRAHEYWRFKRLAVDLVVLNEKKSSYSQNLQEFLEHLVRTSKTAGDGTVQGAVFILRSDLLSIEEVEQLQCAARVTLSGKQGSLAEQVLRMRRTKPMPHSPARPATRRIAADAGATAKLPLEFLMAWVDTPRTGVNILRY